MTVIMMVFMIVSGLLIVLATLFMRHRKTELRYRERMLAMEKGIPLPPEPPGPPPTPWTPRVYLLRGLLWLFTGVGLTAMFLGVSITSSRPPSMQDRLLSAQYLKRQGASDTEVKQYLESAGETRGLPPGWAFVGVVPAGVGLAYLLFYRAEGRKP